jgi:hypothetical protein
LLKIAGVLSLFLKIVDCDPRGSHAPNELYELLREAGRLRWKLCVSAHEEFDGRDRRLPSAFIRADLRDGENFASAKEGAPRDSVDFFFEYLAGMPDASRLPLSSPRDIGAR